MVDDIPLKDIRAETHNAFNLALDIMRTHVFKFSYHSLYVHGVVYARGRLEEGFVE